MPDARFESLRLELLRSGVAPVYVERTIVELDEHYTDLEAAALTAGQTPEEAALTARTALGNERAIAAAILQRPELLAFSTRWPRVAYIGTLPGLPLVFCIEHRPELARWGAALGAATVFVGGMMAAIDWLIFVA